MLKTEKLFFIAIFELFGKCKLTLWTLIILVYASSCAPNPETIYTCSLSGKVVKNNGEPVHQFEIASKPGIPNRYSTWDTGYSGKSYFGSPTAAAYIYEPKFTSIDHLNGEFDLHDVELVKNSITIFLKIPQDAMYRFVLEDVQSNDHRKDLILKLHEDNKVSLEDPNAFESSFLDAPHVSSDQE